MEEYFVEYNGKITKSYKNKQRALNYAEKMAKNPDACINIWDGTREIIWSNY